MHTVPQCLRCSITQSMKTSVISAEKGALREPVQRIGLYSLGGLQVHNSLLGVLLHIHCCLCVGIRHQGYS